MMKYSVCHCHNLLIWYLKIDTINTPFMTNGKSSDKKSTMNPESKNVMKSFHLEKIIS